MPTTRATLLLHWVSLWSILAQSLMFHHKASVWAFDLVCPSDGAIDSSTPLLMDDPNGQPFSEISGLAMSPTQTAPTGEPVLYGVNDSEGGKRLGVFDSGNGQRLLTLRLESLLSSLDWESLAIGSCGNRDAKMTCIYIADAGDNDARTSHGMSSRRNGIPYRIFKVKEPLLEDYQDNLEDYQDNAAVPPEDTEVLEFDYHHPSSPTEFADCEAVFLDHTGWGGSIGDIYLLTKWNTEDSWNKNRLFHIPASAWMSEGAYSPAAVGEYGVNGLWLDIGGEIWRSADMTLDGTLIAMTGRTRSYLYARCPGVSVPDALTGEANPCHEWNHPVWSPLIQYETIAWTPDGDKSLQVPECNGCIPSMRWTIMDYDNPAMTIRCVDDMPVDNRAPIARCRRRWRTVRDSTCTVVTSVDDGSFDPDGDTITTSFNPPPPYDIGDTWVTLTVTDTFGEYDSCTERVRVRPPSNGGCQSSSSPKPKMKCKDRIKRARAPICTVYTTIDNGSFDRNGGTITRHLDPAPPYGIGTTWVTLTATNTFGVSNTCTKYVKVRLPKHGGYC